MFLFVLFALVNVAISETCNQELIKAQGEFTRNLNISGALDWKTPDELRSAVEQKFANDGALGLREVCQAFRLYRISITDFDKCARVVVLIRNETTGQATGITRQQAYNYFSLMAQLDYACGGGYEIFANHDACLANTFVKQTAALKDCRDKFFYQVNNDPHRDTDVCGYATDATQCYQNIFAKCSDTSGFFGCEYARVGIHLHFTQCTDVFCIANHKFSS